MMNDVFLQSEYKPYTEWKNNYLLQPSAYREVEKVCVGLKRIYMLLRTRLVEGIKS